MLIRCAWCDLDMGEKEPYEDKTITHSICDRCEKSQFANTNITWHCQYCTETFPHFKALVEHYEQEHHQVLQRFQIRNIKTKARGITSALNPDDACAFFGWKSEDCKVEVLE